MRSTVRRTYQVVKTDTFLVHHDHDLNLRHAIALHPEEFSSDLTFGGSALDGWTCELITEEYSDTADPEGLRILVTHEEVGNVIDMKGRRKK